MLAEAHLGDVNLTVEKTAVGLLEQPKKHI